MNDEGPMKVLHYLNQFFGGSAQKRRPTLLCR